MFVPFCGISPYVTVLRFSGEFVKRKILTGTIFRMTLGQGIANLCLTFMLFLPPFRFPTLLEWHVYFNQGFFCSSHCNISQVMFLSEFRLILSPR